MRKQICLNKWTREIVHCQGLAGCIPRCYRRYVHITIVPLSGRLGNCKLQGIAVICIRPGELVIIINTGYGHIEIGIVPHHVVCGIEVIDVGGIPLTTEEVQHLMQILGHIRILHIPYRICTDHHRLSTIVFLCAHHTVNNDLLALS